MTPYNQRLLKKTMGIAGKTAVIVAGAAYGFFRGMQGMCASDDLPGAETRTRLDELEKLIGQVKLESVSPANLTQAIQKANADISAELDRKFEVQSLAVGSLREMVAQTDSLLMKVLDQLESAQLEDAQLEDSRLEDSQLEDAGSFRT